MTGSTSSSEPARLCSQASLWSLPGDGLAVIRRCTEASESTVVPINNFLYCPASNFRVPGAKACDFLQCVM